MNAQEDLPHRQALIRIGQDFWQRGWSRGTSSNFSAVTSNEPIRLLITASGKDKGALNEEDFVYVDEAGKLVSESDCKSSAETLLHCWAVVHRGARSVLHTHSVWATILSTKFLQQGGIWLEGFEMLKGLQGITTHQTRVWLPVFANTQDMVALGQTVADYWATNESNLVPGFLIAGHGMYAWGNDIATATRHVEVLEFLLECSGRAMMMR